MIASRLWPCLVSAVKSLSERLKTFPAEKCFVVYALSLGGGTLFLAVLRAASMGLSYDEAYTYLFYVHPSFKASFFKAVQLLNNHILYTLCAKILEFTTGIQFNEFLLRMPSLISGGIYLYFACKLSKPFRLNYLVFALFVLNPYLNEFFSLARGYGMAAACIAGALYGFERWQRDISDISMFNVCMGWFCCASLANSIAFYVWGCALPIMIVLIMRGGRLRAYAKNPFNAPMLAVAIFVCAFTVRVTRRGMPIYSSHDFYHCLMSIPGMIFSEPAAIMAFAGLVAVFFTFSLIKYNARNEYLMMLLTYAGICLASALLFRHRGYPVGRTMLPVYPLFVLAVAKSVNWSAPINWLRYAAMACLAILGLQFAAKVSLNYTAEWKDDYTLRADVLRYTATHVMGESEDDFNNFVADYGSQHPTVIFYFKKLEYMSGREYLGPK